MALEQQLAENINVPNGSCITIGTFDGVHIGHQALLNKCVEVSRKHSLTSIALTFKNPPRLIINPSRKIPYLYNLEKRVSLIAETGVEIIHTIEFDIQMRMMPVAEFISLLQRALKLQCIVLGQEARIGHDRRNVAELRELYHDKELAIIGIDTISTEYGTISSSAIRRALGRGDVQQAATMLGRLYERGGKVTRGTGRAREIIAPTANIAWSKSSVMPRRGIYATLATIPEYNTPLPSVTYIGKNPTLGGQPDTFETHIFGWNKDLYGKYINVQFVKFIRPDKKFETVEELSAQLKRDLGDAQQIMTST